MTNFIKKSALVVEDEPLVAATIVDALSDEYSVSAAETVADAVCQLRETELAVALLDCLLPDGDAAAIIAAGEAREVAIVLMSGNPEQIATYSAGRLPFLSKPFRIEELRKTLRAVLPEARHAPSAGRASRPAVIGPPRWLHHCRTGGPDFVADLSGDFRRTRESAGSTGGPQRAGWRGWRSWG